MKIVVSASGKNLSDSVDPRFGRASYFLLVDTESNQCEVLENKQNLQASQGAGVQSASLVAGRKPAAVLTGHCGPKAFQVLKAAGIDVIVGVEGSVSDAVERFRKGEYKPASTSDVQGHW